MYVFVDVVIFCHVDCLCDRRQLLSDLMLLFVRSVIVFSFPLLVCRLVDQSFLLLLLKTFCSISHISLHTYLTMQSKNMQLVCLVFQFLPRRDLCSLINSVLSIRINFIQSPTFLIRLKSVLYAMFIVVIHILWPCHSCIIHHVCLGRAENFWSDLIKIISSYSHAPRYM